MAVCTALAAGLALSATASAQYSFVTNQAGSFVDISGTGTLVTSGDDSSGTFVVPANCANPLFPAGTINICTNGHAGYGGVDTQYSNTAIPGTFSYAGNVACVYWDDLISNRTGAAVYAQVVGNTLIIQWNNMDHFASSVNGVTFEMKIFGANSGPGGSSAQYIYQSTDFGDATINNGASATIGFQLAPGDASQYAFNTAGSVQAGTVLTLIGQAAPSGACCLANGSCVVATSASCTAQSGIYRGDNTVCATANCPQPPPPCANVTAAIGGPSSGWPSTHGLQTGRLFRDGVPDTCAVSASGGAALAGSFNYDRYDFVNGTAAAACVHVDFNTACTGTNFIYAGAYLNGSYNPANPDAGVVASLGASPNPTASMSFNVPAGATFQIVVAEVTAGAGCQQYNFVVTGLSNCGGSTPCYANCDGSTIAPILNVNDFICFQTKYAAGDTYANCDGSTIAPILNVNDFICFQTRYAAGCP